MSLLLMQLPLRLVEEANPEWRLALWIHALQMVGLSLFLIGRAGGMVWLRHFFFPTAFMLVAVPWPIPLEQAFIQGLMRGVAAITVEVSGMLGVPALQHGNIIRIGSGWVGIDEACSGVRSLQTALFVACFIGELQRFGFLRRALLLVASLGVAMFANTCRTTFLVVTAARDGLDRMHSLHDAAGSAALWGTLGLLWGVSWVIGRGHQLPSTASTRPPVQGNDLAFLPIRLRASVGVIIWFLAVEVSTETWYRFHETSLVTNPAWRIQWPSEQGSFRELPIAETTRAMLRFDEGRAAGWSDEEANQWQMFWFRWPAGKNSAQLAKSHTPDICLRGAGYQLSEDLGMKSVSAAGIHLPIRHYIFTQQARQLHVFYCLWEDRIAISAEKPSALVENGSQSSRLAAVMAGRRHLGQQVLEIAIEGPESAASAIKALERELRLRIVSEIPSMTGAPFDPAQTILPSPLQRGHRPPSTTLFSPTWIDLLSTLSKSGAFFEPPLTSDWQRMAQTRRFFWKHHDIVLESGTVSKSWVDSPGLARL